MRKKWVVLVILLCAVGSLGTYAAFHYIHQREIRRQIFVAASAVSESVDYSMTSAYLSADLAARQKLDALDAEDLSNSDRETLLCIGNYLNATESLNSSSSIETTRLREGITMDAAKKMDGCMSDFRKR